MASKSNNNDELKVEDKQLRDYELVFIIAPEVGEDTLAINFFRERNGV